MKFYANVKVCVNNFALSSKDALLPLYETIVTSIHVIDSGT